MIAAILEELWHTISHEPLVLVLELVQFAILIFIIKAVGFGVGSYRGIVPNQLDARRARITEELETASVREAEADAAPVNAESIRMAAVKERETVLAGADREAVRVRERIEAEAHGEAQQLERQAEETLEHEREEVLAGVRDSLVDVVTTTTRYVLDEGFTPAQQRSMIQEAILASVDDLENVTLR